jgi:hypothetical protein
MAKFFVAPHTNHLLTYLLCIFSYLKAQDRSRVEFNHKKKQDWSHRMFADFSVRLASHACSGPAQHEIAEEGILIFLNGSPIKWKSKRQQNTVKASAYGSEYTSLRIAKEMIEAHWYKKLRMNGIALDGPQTGLLTMNLLCLTPSFLPHASKRSTTPSISTRQENWSCIAE